MTSPHLSPLPVTVARPVKNEEANLSRCLERLRRFAEIVVIDSGSTTEVSLTFTSADRARLYIGQIVDLDPQETEINASRSIRCQHTERLL